MICRAILRKSPQAGQQCPNAARRDGWCKVHDPKVVVPNLERKRERLVDALLRVEADIAAYNPTDPIENGA